jgi:nitrous oxide reductase accessory protein NosL
MRKIVILLVLFVALYGSTDGNQSAKKWRVEPIKEDLTIKYDKNTTCLVRNIAVYKNPKWIAQIEVRGGKKVYFSSPKSMFEFYFRPAKWYDVGVKSEKDFRKIIVTDFNTLKAINAREAFYLYGSRVISPAGDDLIAFSTKESAEAFLKINGGSRVFTFDKVSDALIRLLNGRI